MRERVPGVGFLLIYFFVCVFWEGEEIGDGVLGVETPSVGFRGREGGMQLD